MKEIKVTREKINTHQIFNIMDEEQKGKLMADCACGSGKKFGECCGKEEMCFCGSGKMAKDCCMVSSETHGDAAE